MVLMYNIYNARFIKGEQTIDFKVLPGNRYEIKSYFKLSVGGVMTSTRIVSLDEGLEIQARLTRKGYLQVQI